MSSSPLIHRRGPYTLHSGRSKTFCGRVMHAAGYHEGEVWTVMGSDYRNMVVTTNANLVTCPACTEVQSPPAKLGPASVAHDATSTSSNGGTQND